MGKKSGRNEPERKAKRKLARATMELQLAQEKQIQARARGKQEVEQARMKAARWTARAAQRAELAAEKVARAEARLLRIRSGDEDGAPDTGSHGGGDRSASGDGSVEPRNLSTDGPAQMSAYSELFPAWQA